MGQSKLTHLIRELKQANLSRAELDHLKGGKKNKKTKGPNSKVRNELSRWMIVYPKNVKKLSNMELLKHMVRLVENDWEAMNDIGRLNIINNTIFLLNLHIYIFF